jgi:hypothetical protein
MPDLLEGNPADISWYPPDTKEKGEKLGNFFATTAAPPKIVARIPKVLDALKKEYSNISTWVSLLPRPCVFCVIDIVQVLIGYCWGGKVGAFGINALGYTGSSSGSRLPFFHLKKVLHSKPLV